MKLLFNYSGERLELNLVLCGRRWRLFYRRGPGSKTFNFRTTFTCANFMRGGYIRLYFHSFHVNNEIVGVLKKKKRKKRVSTR